MACPKTANRRVVTADANCTLFTCSLGGKEKAEAEAAAKGTQVAKGGSSS